MFFYVPPCPEIDIYTPFLTEICTGTTLTFYANSYYTGIHTPYYQWYDSGTLISGATGDTLTYSNFTIDISGKSYISCKMTGSTCDERISNTLTIDITQLTTPALIVSFSGSTKVCNGENVICYVSSLTGGTIDDNSYQWQQRNGEILGPWVNIVGATSSIISYQAFFDMQVRCNMSVPYGCLTTSGATSNILSMNSMIESPHTTGVNVYLPITTSSELSNNLYLFTGSTYYCCEGISGITMGAVAINGGATPIFSFYIGEGGVYTLAQSGTSSGYTYYSPKDGNSIKITMQSSEPCTLLATRTFFIDLLPRDLVGIDIHSIPLEELGKDGFWYCYIDPVETEFTPKLPNNAPVGFYVYTLSGCCENSIESYTKYQWQSGVTAFPSTYHNIPRATGYTLFISSPVTNNMYRCQVTTSCLCWTGSSSAVSKTIILSSRTGTTGDVVITSNGDTICSGDTICFSGFTNITPTGYTYQWERSLNASIWQSIPNATGSTYCTNSIDNGTYIRLDVKTAGPTHHYSNIIQVTVNADIPVLIISSNPLTNSANTICYGTNVNFFIDEEQNLGSDPTLDWYKNTGGTWFLVNGYETYSDDTLNNGDQIKLVANPYQTCYSGTITSNIITASVETIEDISIIVTSNYAFIPKDDSLIFRAFAKNYGDNGATYKWYVGNTIVQNGTSPIYNAGLSYSGNQYFTTYPNGTCSGYTWGDINVKCQITGTRLCGNNVVMSPIITVFHRDNYFSGDSGVTNNVVASSRIRICNEIYDMGMSNPDEGFPCDVDPLGDNNNLSTGFRACFNVHINSGLTPLNYWNPGVCNLNNRSHYGNENPANVHYFIGGEDENQPYKHWGWFWDYGYFGGEPSTPAWIRDTGVFIQDVNLLETPKGHYHTYNNQCEPEPGKSDCDEWGGFNKLNRNKPQRLWRRIFDETIASNLANNNHFGIIQIDLEYLGNADYASKWPCESGDEPYTGTTVFSYRMNKSYQYKSINLCSTGYATYPSTPWGTVDRRVYKRGMFWRFVGLTGDDMIKICGNIGSLANASVFALASNLGNTIQKESQKTHARTSSGDYEMYLYKGFTGTIIPHLDNYDNFNLPYGYPFSPSGITITNLSTDNCNIDFQTYYISGWVSGATSGNGISGVTMTITDNTNNLTYSTTTYYTPPVAVGYYVIYVKPGTNVTLTPSGWGYNYTPSSRSYNVSSNQTNQNFTVIGL